MKIVINKCFGGFSLSAKAIARLAELQGRMAYFFVRDLRGPGGFNSPLKPVSVEEADARSTFMFHAYDVPNPNEVLPDQSNWNSLSMKDRIEQNRIYDLHSLDCRPDNRSDALLVQVVEELGDAANGKHAELAVVEIPDGVEYVIEEYDGNETIAEAHRTWG